MSEKKEHPRAPIETQQGGFDGERTDSGADELSPKGEASGRSPSEHVSRETSEIPASEAKNKRSSVYIYLLVLFGAAFLMLLLAYFVQQRNSETTISDLRNSMNLSREELMDEIKGLSEHNEALQREAAGLKGQLDELQQQKDELEEQSFWREKDLQTQLFSWNALWGLEQNFRDQDYEACTLFFQNATTSNYYLTPPEAAERVEEIYWALVEKGVLNEEDFPLSTILGTGTVTTP